MFIYTIFRDGTASMTFCLRPKGSNYECDEESPDEEDEDYRFLHRNYSFSEEYWLKYDRQEDELNYHVRNKQVHKRVREIQRVVKLLEDLHCGRKVQNVIGTNLSLKQFKVGNDLAFFLKMVTNVMLMFNCSTEPVI